MSRVIRPFQAAEKIHQDRECLPRAMHPGRVRPDHAGLSGLGEGERKREERDRCKYRVI